jgi:hypothetical protein
VKENVLAILGVDETESPLADYFSDRSFHWRDTSSLGSCWQGFYEVSQRLWGVAGLKAFAAQYDRSRAGL